MIAFVLLNFIILILNGGFFYQMMQNEIIQRHVYNWNNETVFVIGWISSLGMFCVSYWLYLTVFCKDAGYTKPIDND